MSQFLLLAFHQAVHGDTRPGTDDLGDIVLVDFLLEQAVLGMFLILQSGQFLLQGRQAAILEFSQLVQVIVMLGLLHLLLDLVDFLLDLAHFGDARLFFLPAGHQCVVLALHLGQFFFDLLQPVSGLLVLFLGQCLFLDLQLQHPAAAFIQFRGHGVDFRPEPGSGFIDEVDGLVRQETFADIPVGQRCGSDKGRILDADAMMHFIPFLQASQDRDRVLHTRFLDENGLEAALQGTVFFDIFAVLVDGRRTDAAQFPAGQHRLQDVAGIHGAF